jgi:hypothetical protein
MWSSFRSSIFMEQRSSQSDLPQVPSRNSSIIFTTSDRDRLTDLIDETFSHYAPNSTF